MLATGNLAVLDGVGCNLTGSATRQVVRASATARVHNLTLWMGNATNGGAVEFLNSGTISFCTFRSNRAGLDGGAVKFHSTGHVKSCVFEDNDAPSGDGGALWFGAAGTVTDSSFSRNAARRGGGVFAGNGQLDLRSTRFLAGHVANATDGGAAVFLTSSDGSSNAMLVRVTDVELASDSCTFAADRRPSASLTWFRVENVYVSHCLLLAHCFHCAHPRAVFNASDLHQRHPRLGGCLPRRARKPPPLHASFCRRHVQQGLGVLCLQSGCAGRLVQRHLQNRLQCGLCTWHHELPV